MIQRKKICMFLLTIFAVGVITSCGEEKHMELIEEKRQESILEENVKEVTEAPKVDEMKEKFGEYCISDQTFEVELSEYEGKVYFVPFAPSKKNKEFCIKIIQDGKVLDELYPYLPKELECAKFVSLDAVSFFDINGDEYTDIVTIQTYGSKSFAMIYYGFSSDAMDFERSFDKEIDLSENITSQLEELTIPNIRKLLIGEKKNGEFENYQEAYEERIRLSDLESAGEREYNLIYVDEDDIPELVDGRNGYYVNLYTYKDGRWHTLMDCWAYGAMGNAGYEYLPKKNSLRNFNSDADVLYTTYMTVSQQSSIENVLCIETRYYEGADSNGNGKVDEEEYYGKIFIGDREITQEEYDSYDVGGYEYIEVNMDLETICSILKEK